MRVAWNKGLHTGIVPKTAFKKGEPSPRKGKNGITLCRDCHKQTDTWGARVFNRKENILRASA